MGDYEKIVSMERSVERLGKELNFATEKLETAWMLQGYIKLVHCN